MSDSLTDIFREVDGDLKKIGMVAVGSTAVITIVINNKLYCANVGDSEACLVKEVDNNLETVNLVELHKGTNDKEMSRVEAAGGFICWGRVNGNLAVTRAFGDMMFKKPRTENDLVSVDPYISENILDTTCKYIILACDGLWDVCTHKDAASLVHKCIKDNKTLDETANVLTSYALAEGSRDNVTVEIIKLDWI